MRKGRSKSITLADVRKLHFPKGAKMIYYTPSKHLPEVLEKHRFLFRSDLLYQRSGRPLDLVFDKTRPFSFPELDRAEYRLNGKVVIQK